MSSVRPENRPIDPRASRFGAAVTTVVLALVLVLGQGSPVGGFLLTIQTLVFACGAVLGLQAQPYGWFYRRFVRPRLGPPTELEDPGPPRFAQAVGLMFALAGTIGWILDVPALMFGALGLALAAAFLNAAFNFCLGCELFLLVRRMTGPVESAPKSQHTEATIRH